MQCHALVLKVGVWRLRDHLRDQLLTRIAKLLSR